MYRPLGHKTCYMGYTGLSGYFHVSLMLASDAWNKLIFTFAFRGLCDVYRLLFCRGSIQALVETGW